MSGLWNPSVARAVPEVESDVLVLKGGGTVEGVVTHHVAGGDWSIRVEGEERTVERAAVLYALRCNSPTAEAWRPVIGCAHPPPRVPSNAPNPPSPGDTRRLSPPPAGRAAVGQTSRARPPSIVDLSVTTRLQINPQFTEHAGSGLEVRARPLPLVGLGLGGTWFWHSQPTDFTDKELLTKAVQAPTAAEAVSVQWEAHAGLELTPLSGSIRILGADLDLQLLAAAGGGVVSTRVELNPAPRSRTFGDTGLQPAAVVGVGLRVRLGDHFAVDLALRDVLFPSKVTRIRGCTESDVAAVIAGTGSSHCASAFPNRTDAALADQVLTNDVPVSSALRHLVDASVALSLTF
jgi:hypothetical protein